MEFLLTTIKTSILLSSRAGVKSVGRCRINPNKVSSVKPNTSIKEAVIVNDLFSSIFLALAAVGIGAMFYLQKRRTDTGDSYYQPLSD